MRNSYVSPSCTENIIKLSWVHGQIARMNPAKKDSLGIKFQTYIREKYMGTYSWKNCCTGTCTFTFVCTQRLLYVIISLRDLYITHEWLNKVIAMKENWNMYYLAIMDSSIWASLDYIPFSFNKKLPFHWTNIKMVHYMSSNICQPFFSTGKSLQLKKNVFCNLFYAFIFFIMGELLSCTFGNKTLLIKILCDLLVLGSLPDKGREQYKGYLKFLGSGWKEDSWRRQL